MKSPIRFLGIVAGAGAIAMSAAISGCSLSSNHIDCNVVKLQTDSGRSNSEIAGALGVSESDVASCHATPPAASPY